MRAATAQNERDFQAGRPYRSHKVPACDRCRKRKVRCTIDIPNQPCLLCRLQNVTCEKQEDVAEDSIARAPKRRRTVVAPNRNPRTADAPNPFAVQRPSGSRSALGPAEDDERGAMIVGPAAAEDMQIIEEYMTSKRSPQLQRQDRSYNILSNDPARPILYQSVPARRKGWKGPLPGSSQREILEQILGPLAQPLIAVYFDRIHPWFPILERSQFESGKDNGKLVCSALVCIVYAMSLVYWHTSAELKCHPRPDVVYTWNLAIAALQEDLLEPSLSTVCAALVDLGGRPTTSIIGNVLINGSTGALAHSLGLNRDPSSWNISEDEKRVRIKLWWGVLIHDRWSSFAHGVPCVVVKDQYDVSLPDRTTLLSGTMLFHERGADCFLALCTLTEVLADILPLIYSLNAKSVKESPRKLRRIQTDLDEWEEALPGWIRDTEDDLAEPQSGSCSLRLSYLAVKMLISRLALHAAVKNQESNGLERKVYYQSELLKSAQTIAKYICSLNRDHLQEYWLPYNAYFIASAAVVLLRCAIDSSDESAAISSKSSLQKLMERLRLAKESDDWDVGDICLAQCNDPVAAISAVEDTIQGHNNDDENVAESSTRHATTNWEPLDFGSMSFLPVSAPWGATDDLQYPWASLWEMLEPPGSML